MEQSELRSGGAIGDDTPKGRCFTVRGANGTPWQAVYYGALGSAPFWRRWQWPC